MTFESELEAFVFKKRKKRPSQMERLQDFCFCYFLLQDKGAVVLNVIGGKKSGSFLPGYVGENVRWHEVSGFVSGRGM